MDTLTAAEARAALIEQIADAAYRTGGVRLDCAAEVAEAVLAVLETARTTCETCGGTGWVCDGHGIGDDCWQEHDGSRSGCPACTDFPKDEVWWFPRQQEASE